MLILPSNFSPHQKSLVYVCRDCVGDRCLKKYREGRNCTGKPMSEFDITGKSSYIYPDYLLQNNVPMFKFLGNLIQPLMGEMWSLVVRRCLKVLKV